MVMRNPFTRDDRAYINLYPTERRGAQVFCVLNLSATDGAYYAGAGRDLQESLALCADVRIIGAQDFRGQTWWVCWSWASSA